MGDTFGRAFRVTTFGESHGRGLGLIIDGCPPGLELDLEAIQAELDRRRPGQSRLTTPRKEPDSPDILSGFADGKTLGTALSMVFYNQDVDSSKYLNMKELYRPSHADYTYEARYGVRDWRGGGRASARETVSRVAAGAVARQVLTSRFPGLEVVAWVSQVGEVKAAVDPSTVTREAVDAHITRCPQPEGAEAMERRIKAAQKDHDTVGGIVTCVARGVPAGLGDPVFDKLDGELAKAMMSLPAAKGVEIGSGFQGILLKGSEHNDPFVMRDGRVATTTNHSGGIQGGISNGEDVLVRVAFKPVATHFKEQQTVTSRGEETTFAAKGRHDPCVLPRAVPIVESMMCLVLCDHLLRYAALLR
ncbi:MAG: chorismate synthase [Myxococcota bacterium]|jgi:chorismate synthase